MMAGKCATTADRNVEFVVKDSIVAGSVDVRGGVRFREHRTKCRIQALSNDIFPSGSDDLIAMETGFAAALFSAERNSPGSIRRALQPVATGGNQCSEKKLIRRLR